MSAEDFADAELPNHLQFNFVVVDDKGVALLKEMAATLEDEGEIEVETKEDIQDEPPEPEELQLVEEQPVEQQGLMARRGM